MKPRASRGRGPERPKGVEPVSTGDSWEGALSVHPRGFGFVAAAGHEDVYLSPENIVGAMHGDKVRVSVIARTPRGAEGRIDDVVVRRSARVAGVLRKRRHSAWLEPDDSRIRGPIVLSSTPHGAQDGEAAVAEITRFPEHANENPEGNVVVVLGEPGDPNVEVAKILVRESVEEQHTEAAMREAEAMASRLALGDREGRKDLRSVPFLTIDPEDARDHDDAVYAEKVADGFEVWIAIADVSEYVQPDSALDAEALARGCTIYLPDRALPMLPKALAADVCSLLPEQERFCLCVTAHIDHDGQVTRFDVCEGRMRGAAMLTYGSVARTLGFSEAPPKSPQAEAFKKDLRALDEVARKLRKLRIRRGALDFDLPEPKLLLDEKTGQPVGVKRRAEDPGVKRAYQMIEELMILANELVAQWLGKRRSPAVYRVHGKPDLTKLERLEGVCERLGAPFDLDDMQKPDGISKWLRKIAEHPRKGVLETLLLRSMKQATYDIDNIGHFGLASEAYVHFTSPIRRYPDVQVHRAVKRLLRGGKPDTSPAAIEELAASATDSSVRERAAMDVEREVMDLYRALYMRDRIGDVFEGSVTAVTGGGLYVALDDPFVDVLVRYESLGPDRYSIDDDEISVVGERSGDRVGLGDRVTVTVEDVQLQRRAVFARRVVPEKVVSALDRAEPGRESVGPRRGRGRKGALEQRRDQHRAGDTAERGSRKGRKGDRAEPPDRAGAPGATGQRRSKRDGSSRPPGQGRGGERDRGGPKGRKKRRG